MIKRIKKSAWTAKRFRQMGATVLQTTHEFVRLIADDRYFDEWYSYLSDTSSRSTAKHSFDHAKINGGAIPH